MTKRESRRSSSQAGKGGASGAGSGIIGRLGPSAQSELPPPAGTPMDAGGMLEQMMRQILELIAEEDLQARDGGVTERDRRQPSRSGLPDGNDAGAGSAADVIRIQ